MDCCCQRCVWRQECRHAQESKEAESAVPAGAESEAGAETEAGTEEVSLETIVDAAILVQGYEWGPGVPKIILEFQNEVSEVSAENLTVVTADVENVYICDEHGEKTDAASKHVAIEMETLSKDQRSPFTYDTTVNMNKWKESYEISLECADFTVDGRTGALAFSGDCMEKRICPDTERFSKRDSYTGTYQNPFTREEEEPTLHFTAAYPCCEAYAFYECERNEDGTCKLAEDGGIGTSMFESSDRIWLTEEKINEIKDLPIWFVVSADDTVVDPQKYVLPSYQALVKADASNSWLSVFESIEGTDNPEATYTGHFSWVYLLNDQVTGVQDKDAVRTSEDQELFGTTPTNKGGGICMAGDYSNIFDWLNVQSKQ